MLFAVIFKVATYVIAELLQRSRIRIDRQQAAINSSTFCWQVYTTSQWNKLTHHDKNVTFIQIQQGDLT